MSFAWPVALLGLLPVFMLAAVYVWLLHRRRRFALRYSNIALVQNAVARGSLVRRHTPAVLYLLAMTALVVAIARPEASFATPQSTGVVILAIDVSGSMNSADIRPSRIEAARVAVRDFVKKQPKGVRVGVVTFAALAVVVVPPTEDRRQVISAVDYLTLARATNIGDGLLVALNAILEDERGEMPNFAPDTKQLLSGRALHPDVEMIVLLSDGAATTGPPPLQVADRIAQAGIRVYTVGLGASAGGLTAPGNGGFTDRRFMELDEATLKGIAEKTDGEYFTAGNAGELHKVYKDLARRTVIEPKKDELTFLAGGVAALLMVTGSVLAAIWSTRLP